MSAAQVLFQRFWYVSSMKNFGVLEIGMGALYLASKLEECTLRLRDLINVYDLLLQRHGHELHHPEREHKHTAMSYWSQTYYDLKDAIIVAEMQILKRLGFDVLGLIEKTETCQRAWAFLNDALQTPVYALYPVPTIVCAAILLMIRQLAIPLPDLWWELFDADWEDIWAVSGHIMRLYRPKEPSHRRHLLSLLSKHEVRQYLATEAANTN